MRFPRAPPFVLRRAGESATRRVLPPVESPERSRVLKCCLIGPTNAGKSTLLNRLLDQRVAAVSPKIHTTRVNTIGYLTDHDTATQIEFIDAPGSLGPDVPALHREVWDAVMAAEMALVVVDSSDRVSHRQVVRFLGRLGRELQDLERQRGGGYDSDDSSSSSGSGGGGSILARPQTALVLNKVDRVQRKGKLLGVSAQLHDAFPFDWPPFMISAKSGSGVDHLRQWLLLASKPGKWSAPAGIAHTQPPLVRASEIIREQLFAFLKQEIPYLLEQRNVGWTELERPPGALRIDQQLLLPHAKRSAKKVVEGRLPGIADAAREALRQEFDRVVFLHLSVGTVAETDREIEVDELAFEDDSFSSRLVDRARR